MTPEICPHCGAEVPKDAKACPECGSDESTGWSEDTGGSGLGLPDQDFDYGEFVRREFGSKKPIPAGIHWFWWVVGVALLITLLMLWAFR